MIRMTIQVVFFDDVGEQRGVHEVVGIDRDELCPAGLGLSLAEAKQITGGIQQVLAGVQIAEWQADHRACPGCRKQRSLKGPPSDCFPNPLRRTPASRRTGSELSLHRADQEFGQSVG